MSTDSSPVGVARVQSDHCGALPDDTAALLGGLTARQYAVARRIGCYDQPAGPRLYTPPAPDPIVTWEHLVAKYVNRGLSMDRALSAAVKENPEAHRAYLVAYNAQHGRSI